MEIARPKNTIPEGPGKIKTEVEGTLIEGHANHFHLLDRHGKEHLFDVGYFGIPMNEMVKYRGRHLRVKTEVEFLD